MLEADLIAHVRDAAHGESEAQKARRAESAGRAGRGRQDRPMIEMLNKIDLLAPEARAGLLARQRPGNDAPVAVSALTGEGLDTLLSRFEAELTA